MIPLRVFLRGFLCYRQEQEVRFDGSSLWMLSGVNGSGKSAVFDAVTYALFGHHRGGSQQAHELVNKDCNSAAVEFDFTQDGVSYRIRRTLQKKTAGSASGTQQVLHWQPDPAGEGGKWLPVPDTSRKTQFDAWVRDHIGLNFETFTSSVLLLQGRAEKLLDSTAKGRFEVLSGIVDLGRYKRLHERADEDRRACKALVENLRNQVEALPEVTELELVAADNRVAAAEQARGRARAEADRVRALEFEARRWADLQTRLDGLRGRLRQAQALIGDAGTIAGEAARLAELRQVLPAVDAVVKQRHQAQDAETQAQKLLAEAEALGRQAADQAQAVQQALARRARHRQQLEADEKRLTEVGEELARLGATLARAGDLERQRQDLARLEKDLAALPADTGQALDLARRRRDDLAALSRELPWLEQLQQQRGALLEALKARDARQKDMDDRKTRGKDIAARHKAAEPVAHSAAQARQKADQDLAAANAIYRQTEDGWRAFSELEGARTCRQCGQPLTPAHLQEEKTRRDQELAQARARRDAAAKAQQQAAARDREAAAALESLTRELQAARDKYAESRNAHDQSGRDADRCEADCTRAFQSLAPAFRARVADSEPEDWTATTYPSPEELAAARREAATLPAADKLLREAQDRHAARGEMAAQVEAVRRAVANLAAALPADLPAQRQRHVTLEAEKVTLTARARATRDSDGAAEAERERCQREAEALHKRKADRDSQRSAQVATRAHCLKAVEQALKGLPAAWREPAEKAGLAGLHAWQAEQETLQARDVDGRARELQKALAGLDDLRAQAAALDREGEGVPPEARRTVAEVQTLAAAARQEYDARDDDFHQEEQKRVLLLRRKEAREDLGQSLLAREGELNILVLLAQLLGRDRLQLHLVRRAERQIVDHANGVLDRLSGGQLYLRLRGGEGPADEALELEAYNRVTGQEPINVAFLSGSQRFRVAVSLALGIGQYASRQHRPIESVIIDEGFGCLDRNGRQVMVQELQNLRGHLRCILLVSHQEDIADAFADGYHFELTDGSTRITRRQR